jgi:hypothetical protein
MNFKKVVLKPNSFAKTMNVKKKCPNKKKKKVVKKKVVKKQPSKQTIVNKLIKSILKNKWKRL